jgi:hypothetical protein
MDIDVNVRLEKIDKYEDSLIFSIPMEYFWNKLSEEDLLKIASDFVSTGYLSKVLKDLVNEDCVKYHYLSYLDTGVLEFKETLLNLVDELKDNYVKDLHEVEMRKWWSVGRSIEKIITILFPERKVGYTTDPHDEDFYIYDNDNNEDNKMCINLLSGTVYMKNEKTNGRDIDDYFYDLRKQLEDIVKWRDTYKNWYYQLKDENEKLKAQIDNKLFLLT